jgi:hypothetical protein
MELAICAACDRVCLAVESWWTGSEVVCCECGALLERAKVTARLHRLEYLSAQVPKPLPTP